MDTNPTKQHQQFYRDYASGQWSMSELCDRYQISRPTGYKWVDRIENEGLKAVKDRSRAPLGQPNRTPEQVEREILALREKYGWGASKLRQIIERRHPTWRVPARSTVNQLLERHGKLKKSRRRRLWKHPGAVRLETAGPNQIWPADFKGQFRTQDRKYCYPLTVTDHCSRMLLLCKGLLSVRTEGAKPAFRNLFREYGLPDAIRTDNGAPFASTGIHGLCELKVWWMKLGIVHQRIRPTHSIMLGNIRGTAAGRPQRLPIDPWYYLALNSGASSHPASGPAAERPYVRLRGVTVSQLPSQLASELLPVRGVLALADPSKQKDLQSPSWLLAIGWSPDASQAGSA